MSGVERPPRLAERLLERRLPPATAAYLLGDLEERFHRLAADAPRRARLWYWRQAMAALLLPLPGAVGVMPPSGGWRTAATHALRALRRRPATVVATVLPMGLGIGVVATAFSIVWGTVLAGLPFPEADRLVHFERARLAEGVTSLAVTPHDYDAWSREQRSFEELGAYVERSIGLPNEGRPADRFDGVAISASSFRLLRAEAALGRTFVEADESPGAPPRILLGHGLWMSRFGADPAVVGRDIVVDGRPTTVVGVMPEGFGFPIAEAFWLPLRLDFTSIERGDGRLDVFGRLRDGVDIDAARAEFDALSSGLAAAHPETNGGISAVLRSFQDEYVGDDFRNTVWRLLAGATLLLVICCWNAANLLLIQGVRRRGDLAVRRALGATGGALVRQLVGEAALLAGMGALLGVAVAQTGIAWFNRVGADAGVFDLPHGSDSLFWWDVSVSAPTLAATAAATAVTVILAGVVPAIGITRRGAATARGAAASAGGRLQSTLVVGQLTLTVALLLAAGFVARSVGNVADTTERFVPEGVTVMDLTLLSSARLEESVESHRLWLDALERRLTEDPAVAAAAFGARVPLETPRSHPVRVDGRDTASPPAETGVVTVSPAYFDIYGVEPSAGRLLDARDRAQSLPVAVVNERFAEMYLPEGAVGARIRLGDETDGAEPWVEVVGVVPTLWERPNDRDREAGVYLPLSQALDGETRVRLDPWRLAYPTVTVREARAGAVTISLLAGHLYALDASLPLPRIETMADIARQRLGRYRVWGQFWLGFAAAALLLAALGIHGVISHRVTARTAEIGVRRALGATTVAIQRRVVGRAFRDVGIALVAGLWLGTALTGGIAHVLYGVEPNDPSVFVGVACLVAVVTLFSSWWPALRAARVDPRDAMRTE